MKYVKSRYRARWKGIVINEVKRGKVFLGGKNMKLDPLVTVVMILDSKGNKPKRRYVVTRSKSWFVEIEPFDISYINKDWFI